MHPTKRQLRSRETARQCSRITYAAFRMLKEKYFEEYNSTVLALKSEMHVTTAHNKTKVIFLNNHWKEYRELYLQIKEEAENK